MYLDPPTINEIYSWPELLHHILITVLSLVVICTPGSWYEGTATISEEEEQAQEPQPQEPRTQYEQSKPKTQDKNKTE